MSLYHKNPLWASNFISILSFFVPWNSYQAGPSPSLRKVWKTMISKGLSISIRSCKRDDRGFFIRNPFPLCYRYTWISRANQAVYYTPPTPPNNRNSPFCTYHSGKTHVLYPSVSFPRHFSHHPLAPWTDWCPKHSTKPMEPVDDFKGKFR